MATQDDAGGEATLPRPPTVEDLKRICQRLNERGVRYLLVGGMAMNYYGYARMTHDIDFVVDPTPETVEKIKDALSILPDNAAAEIEPGELNTYQVIRVADEIVIDLITHIGDVTVETAGEATLANLDGVLIPIANIDTMIKTKMGLREKDKEDLRFLLLLKRSTPEK